MGTNRAPKPDQLGRARPSRAGVEIDAVAPDEIWEWRGPLLDVEEHAFAGRVEDIPSGVTLAPVRDGQDVLVALRNQVVGRLPAEPASAVTDALARGRLVSTMVTSTSADGDTVEVWVRVHV